MAASAGQALAATPHVAANQTVAFTVNGLAPGTYVFWCSVEQPAGGNHAANGMLGTLTITP
jgi:plastocyanin